MKSMLLSRPAKVLATLITAAAAAVAIGLSAPSADTPIQVRADYDTSPK